MDGGQKTGYGSVWLERIVRDDEVAGSNPVTPMDYEGEATKRQMVHQLPDGFFYFCGKKGEEYEFKGMAFESTYPCCRMYRGFIGLFS